MCGTDRELVIESSTTTSVASDAEATDNLSTESHQPEPIINLDQYVFH